MKSYWIAFINQRGLGAFVFYIWRKLLSLGVSRWFLQCDDLMLCGDYQINGFKHISIEKLTAGPRFRMEAISHSFEQVFTPEIFIGKNVSFGSDVHIGCISKIIIGDNVLCGSHVTIIDHDHGTYAGDSTIQSDPNQPPSFRILCSEPISIGNNVHIGDSVVILKGVTISSGVVIGAGSVVTKSIPCNCIAVGNPARVVKQYDEVTKKWVSTSGPAER